MSDKKEELCLYAIQSQDGKWFRRKGYGGSGESWVENFVQARVFSKIGAARSVLSWWANNYTQYGTPNLVILHIDRVEKVDETDRIAKMKLKKQLAESNHEIRRKQKELEIVQKQLLEAQTKAIRLKQAPIEAEARRLQRINIMRHK